MDDRQLGLTKKYEVVRIGDLGKHTDCFFFVMDLTHDKFARPALLSYARACRDEYPLLALDLLKRLEQDGYEGMLVTDLVLLGYTRFIEMGAESTPYTMEEIDRLNLDHDEWLPVKE